MDGGAINTPPELAIRLAAEGVPVRAIARAMGISSADLREQFDEARTRGRLLVMPRLDWPPQLRPSNRLPNLARLFGIEEKILLAAVARAFKVTFCQGRLVLALIRRQEITNEELHAVYNARDGHETDTEMKIIDVQVCKLRRALRPLGLEVQTLWGYGRRMSWEHRKRALDMLLSELCLWLS